MKLPERTGAEGKLYWVDEHSMTTRGAAKALGVTPGTLRNWRSDLGFPQPEERFRGMQPYYVYPVGVVEEIENELLRRRSLRL